MTFLTNLAVTEILCSFRLVLESKTGNEIPESSRLKFQNKFSANKFTLSDAEDNTSGQSHKLCDETRHSLLSLKESQWNLRQQQWAFLNEGKAIVEQILASEGKSKSKKAGLENQVSDPSRKFNHLIKVIWDRKIVTEFSSLSVPPESVRQSLWWTLKSPKKNSRWVDWEDLNYVRWNSIKNYAQRRRRWWIKEKEVIHWMK